MLTKFVDLLNFPSVNVILFQFSRGQKERHQVRISIRVMAIGKYDALIFLIFDEMGMQIDHQ